TCSVPCGHPWPPRATVRSGSSRRPSWSWRPPSRPRGRRSSRPSTSAWAERKGARRRMGAEPRPVLVVDFGAQYAQLIARRVRECHVYSEIVPFDTPVEELEAMRPAGLILSGGPASVYEPRAPAVDPRLFDLGVPVLGICY